MVMGLPQLKVELDRLQYETKQWRDVNFPGVLPVDQLIGVCEEVGELGHAHLKQKQNIRGTAEEHEATAKDAVGDTMIYLMGYTTALGYEMSSVIRPRLEREEGRITDPDKAYLHVFNRIGRLCRWEADSQKADQFVEVKIRVVGEIIQALRSYCLLRGWNIIHCIEVAWAEVQKRDWIKNPTDGRPRVELYPDDHLSEADKAIGADGK